MAIQEKFTFDDMLLNEVMRHPILLGEFVHNLDQEDHIHEKLPPWEYSVYQKFYLADFSSFVSLCCGRAVGKTVSLTDYIIWILVNNLYPGDYIVYTVPNKVHLDPVFKTLVRLFRTNSLLKHFIEPKRGINSGTHIIECKNTAVLRCRIAGQSGGGANVVGLHTPVIILDEAGFYPWGTWLELQPTLNTWQRGSRVFVAGVPTGQREKNVLHHVDMIDENYSNHRTSSHDNPRYTQADEDRNIAQFGGVDSEDYVHFVLGRHGSPVFSVFDRRNMRIDTYPVYKTKFNGITSTYPEMINRLSLIPPIPDKKAMPIFGIDLGYNDPTAILILYEKNGIIKEHARINFTKVNYSIQERLIDYLDTKFEFPPIIAIDVGNEQGLVHHLTMDEKYYHKNYENRVYPVRFGSWLTLGEDQDGKEIRVKLKPHSVSLLQQYSNNSKIIYSSTDMDLVTELERMTYTKNLYGDVVYTTSTAGGGKRGADHNTAALLCAVVGYNVLMDDGLFVKRPIKLMTTTNQSMI